MDVDDSGTLKIQNFRDALTDLGATVRKVDDGMGKGQGAPKMKDALSQLVDQSRQAAAQVAKNAQGFGILSQQLQAGATATKLQTDAFNQLGSATSGNVKFTAQYGQTVQQLTSSLQAGNTVTAQQAAQLKTLASGYQQTSVAGGQAAASLESFSGKALALAAALAVVSYNALGLLKESAMLAGRVETLGIVMGAMAKNSSVSSLEMSAQAEAVRRLGITTQESKNSVIQFAQANLDVAATSKIARVAQDLAVVAGENSSETFKRLTSAIQVQQPILLRQVGIVTGLQQIYSEYARTLGKTWRELDETEKKQAFVNKILAEGEKVAGAYEASMTSAFKQVGSFARVVEEAKLKLGESLQPAMMLIISTLTTMVNAWSALPGPIQAAASAVLVFSTAMAALSAALLAANILGFTRLVMGLAESFQYLMIGLRAGMGPLIAVTSAFNPWVLAIGALTVALGLAAATYVYFTGSTYKAAVEQERHTAATLADIVALEGTREKYLSAATAITALRAEQEKLLQLNQQDQGVKDKLAAVTADLTEKETALKRAKKEIIDQSPDAIAALSAEIREQDRLTAAIDLTIAAKRRELAEDLPGLQKQKDALLVRKREADAAVAEALRARNLGPAAILRAAQEGGMGEVSASSFGTASDLIDNYDAMKKAARAVDAELAKVSTRFDEVNRAANPEVLAEYNRGLNAIKTGNARREADALGTSLSAMLKTINKTEADLQALSDPRDVENMLKSASIAWDKYTDEQKKKFLAAEKSAKAYGDSIRGVTDSVALRTKLTQLNEVMGEVAFGTEEYTSRLLRAAPEIKAMSTLTHEETKAFTDLADAQDRLYAVQTLIPIYKKLGDQAVEMTRSFQTLASQGVKQLADDFEQLTFKADQEQIVSHQAFTDQMAQLDRDFYEQTVIAKASEVDQKIYQNNRYYADLREGLDRQIVLIKKQQEAERKVIEDRARNARQALDDAQAVAELRYEMEVQQTLLTLELQEKVGFREAEETERIKGEIEGLISNTRKAFGIIRAQADQLIQQEQDRAMAGFNRRKAVGDAEIQQLEAQKDRSIAVNQEMNAQVLLEHGLFSRAVATIYATVAQSLTQGLSGVLLRTKSWKEAMIDIFNSLRNALFGIIDSLVSKWTDGLVKTIMGTGPASGGQGFFGQVRQAAGFGQSMFGGGGAPAAWQGPTQDGAWQGASQTGASGGTVAGMSKAAFTNLAAAGMAAGAGILLERIGEKYFGGPGAAATTFGAVTGAASGAVIGAKLGMAGGGWAGAAIGGGAGALYGWYRSKKNDAKEQRDKFLEELGFGTVDDLRDFIARAGRADAGTELWERAVGVIGRHDIEGNKKWMADVVKILGQIETSKAWDQLIDSAGSARALDKAMQLVGLSFADLKMAVDAGDVLAVEQQVTALNKAMEEQQKRLQGLSQAAAGLQQMAQGFMMLVERDFTAIFEGPGPQSGAGFEAMRGPVEALASEIKDLQQTQADMLAAGDLVGAAATGEKVSELQRQLDPLRAALEASAGAFASALVGPVNDLDAEIKKLQETQEEMLAAGDLVGAAATALKVSELQAKLEPLRAELERVSASGGFGGSPEEFAKLIGPLNRLGNEIAGLQDKQAALLAAGDLVGAEATGEKLKGLQKQFDDMKGDLTPATMDRIRLATEKAQKEFNRMGVVAGAVFAGRLRETGDIVQAMNAIDPTLEIMQTALDTLGLKADGAIGKLLGFRRVIQENEDVVTSLSGITMVLDGLGVASALTQGLFDELSGSVLGLNQELIDRGVDRNDALLLMQPTLQALWEAQDKFKFKTDEATQALINEGLASGIIGPQMKSINEQILGVLLLIAEALGANVDGYREVGDEAVAAKDKIVPGMDEATSAAGRFHDGVEAARKKIIELGLDGARELFRLERAAGAAAEGSSPTGIQQIVKRVKESIAAFAELRRAAQADLKAVESAATSAANSRSFAETVSASDVRTFAAPRPEPTPPIFITPPDPQVQRIELQVTGADQPAVIQLDQRVLADVLLPVAVALAQNKGLA